MELLRSILAPPPLPPPSQPKDFVVTATFSELLKGIGDGFQNNYSWC